MAEEVFGVVVFLNDLLETVEGGNAELVLLRIDAPDTAREEGKVGRVDGISCMEPGLIVWLFP